MSGGAPAGFADHFSRDPTAYAEFRPRYPAALFEWLATLPAATRVAWDAATGSGQAATMLAPHFARVVASDGSTAQIRARTRAHGVHYFVSLAERSGLRSGRVDLVTVAQAYHWLDHPRFHAEAGRVLAPGGALAVWCYGVLQADPAIESALQRFYSGTVGPYWPAGRMHVERGYRDFDIPIAEVNPPPITIRADFTLSRFLGYVRTWSAVGRCITALGEDPVEAFGRELATLWGDPASTRRIAWPVSVRAGRWVG